MQNAILASSDLLQDLANTPKLVAQLIDGVPKDFLNVRDSSQEFSIVENVCHLRDIEIEGYTSRIARILEEDHPALADIDGGRLAVERNYNSQNISEALRLFATARQKSVALLTSLSPDQLAREGTLEGVGTVTINRLPTMMREHDAVHLAELTRLSKAYRK